MNTRPGYGGTFISLDGDELAEAVCDYVRSRGIQLSGPRTVRVRLHGQQTSGLCGSASIFVDPSGHVSWSAVDRLANVLGDNGG